ncbi:unnamed protein product [Phytophthora fragariaefolia]|uniref:Unnamed protein product n=1 Tax=Phytophthora fragariaefolia TaxID=1490495 RepID=A0A9W6YKP8_9STRA|nr:unnamed protein product [Phytophthora fragariaefolia]
MPSPARRALTFAFARYNARLFLSYEQKNMEQSLTTAQDPQTSKVAVGSLAPLTLVDLMPERYSRHMKFLTKLKQIRKVQVCRSATNSRSYIIDVYTTSQSTTRIPTILKTSSSVKEPQCTALFNRADVHVEKQFADFVKLRDELYESATRDRTCT